MASATTARIGVLVLVDALEDSAGGGERFAAGLAAAMPSDRYAVTVCATRAADGTIPRDLSAAGVEWFCLERRGRFDLLAWRRLVRFLRRRRPEVLHAHKFGSNVWGVLIGRLCRVPVVIAHEHTWSYEGQPLRRLIDGWLIGRLATRFVAVSELDRRRMVEVEGVPAARTLYLPNAFVPRPAGERTTDVRAELSLPADAPLVGTVAGLREQKRLDVLIDAFAALDGELSDARLLIVGDGPVRAELEGRAEKLGDRVRFTGMRDDVQSVLGALDVAVMSSDFEGMPLFAFEAMASGTPLVVTSVGALPDVIRDGENGVVVPRRDPEALSAALGELLRSPKRRQELADAARVRVRDFSMESVAGTFAALYDQSVAEARGRGRR